jgi:hypothetical protein
MAKLGIIPNQMAKYAIPACLIYAKAIKWQWRYITPNNQDKVLTPTKPAK